MIEKLSISLMLFFNSLTSSVDPNFSNERNVINQINKEVKVLERKIEWIQTTDESYARRTVKTNEITDEITKLKGKIVKIEKVAKLKEKWAMEDSVAVSKK
jgi:hypothetical protein